MNEELVTNSKSVVISEDEIKALVLSHKDAITKSAIDGLIESARNSLNWSMRNTFEETLGAEIKKIIEQESASIAEAFREQIRTAVVSACTNVGAQLATTLIATATKNLESSWHVSDISKELFG